MGEILELAEALWKGETDTFKNHPFGVPRGIEKIADSTWFYRGFANTIIRETGNGLVIVDPAAHWETKKKFEDIRAVTQKHLNTAIFTHGHVDHVFGVEDYVDEAKSNGWPIPRVIAHEALPARFKRYRESVAWNAIINWRQFLGGEGEPVFPDSFYFPDTTYVDRTTLNIGDVSVFLKHSRGETDDATYVFFPDNRVLCTGDLFIWSVPNAGNPQKVQRYAVEWAAGLREMAALEPEYLLPGHGVPVIGADRVLRALNDTAAFLETIHKETLALMNRGLSLDTVLHTVKVPEELSRRPYLQPVYDETEFIVRNIWRLYGGWYDGTPSHLKPAPERAQAEEIARLAGGADKLAERAERILDDGDLRLACHLADWAYLVSPENEKVREIGSRVYAARAEAESSTMAIGIYRTAAKEIGSKPGETEKAESVMKAQDKRGTSTSE